MKIYKPFYMIGKRLPCWHCGEKISVIGFIAVKTDNDEQEGMPCTLNDITSIPVSLLNYIQARVPNFKLCYSRTIGDRYYGSVCPSCGKLYGDHFLHHEPGIAFFPNTNEDAAALYITQLPTDDVIELEAGCHYGTACIILEHAKKIS
tara:strand:- start:5283 stop:5726 length:444 start_codon:yes stop_codon:yes gene_type:complete